MEQRGSLLQASPADQHSERDDHFLHVSRPVRVRQLHADRDGLRRPQQAAEEELQNGVAAAAAENGNGRHVNIRGEDADARGEVALSVAQIEKAVRILATALQIGLGRIRATA